MNTKTLIQKIEDCFPYVEKPQALSLAFHKAGCLQCDALGEDLEPYVEKEIPPQGLREVYTEMSCLSAKAWRWVLPSYLRYCVLFMDESREFTEFLIYNLSPADEYKNGVIERLSELSKEQLDCIHSFLMWCQTSEHWASKYCHLNLTEAATFVRRLNT